jgi:hypothetical protein
MHPEGPATGHLDTDFLGFHLSLANAEVVLKFQVVTSCISRNPSDLTSSE